MIPSVAAGVPRKAGLSIPVPSAPYEYPDGPSAGVDRKARIRASVESAGEGLMGVA